MPEPPLFPIGAFDQSAVSETDARGRLIDSLESASQVIRDAVSEFSDQQLDLPYRNWTVRQIVHHVGDSHMHSYIRFKWSLTEDAPLIKAYDEGAWSELADARLGDVTSTLTILDGLHRRWAVLLRSMSAQDFDRTFTHPQTTEVTSLSLALPYYVWHGRHHTGQIDWVRANRM